MSRKQLKTFRITRRAVVVKEVLLFSAGLKSSLQLTTKIIPLIRITINIFIQGINNVGYQWH